MAIWQQAKNSLQERTHNYRFKPRIQEKGIITGISGGVITIHGLFGAEVNSLLLTEDGTRAVVLDLTASNVSAILLTQNEKLVTGTQVYSLDTQLSVPVDDDLLGRVINPLGKPLDRQGDLELTRYHPIDVRSPPIIERDYVKEPLYSGNKIIDTMLPIGKGQRELIIGDNGLGKTSLALDTVLNQMGRNVRCVYVIIGQKRSDISNIIDTLQQYDAFSYTTVLVAESTEKAGLQYIAPYAGCTIGEQWMRRGHDTLIVYDDLTSHANCYREMSLLLERPPGREAYPADIFYLHSRLLERSTHLKAELGGGSLTALPIIETKEGELTDYIPTNLISITDGQIFLNEKLFDSGFLPAIDVTLSVSRLGGNAQAPAIKREAGNMKLEYLQFLELELFTKLGTSLDEKTQQKITRGKLLRYLLKQKRLQPLTIKYTYCWLIAYNERLFDDMSRKELELALQRLHELAHKTELQLSNQRQHWKNAIKQELESINA